METKILNSGKLPLTKGQEFLAEWRRRRAIDEEETKAFIKTERFQEILEELRRMNAANGIITPGV